MCIRDSIEYATGLVPPLTVCPMGKVCGEWRPTIEGMPTSPATLWMRTVQDGPDGFPTKKGWERICRADDPNCDELGEGTPEEIVVQVNATTIYDWACYSSLGE